MRSCSKSDPGAEQPTGPEDASDDLRAWREAAQRFMKTFQMERFYAELMGRRTPASDDSPESVMKAIRTWYEQQFAPLELERETQVYTGCDLATLAEFFSTREGQGISAKAGRNVSVTCSTA